jgi:hypothetical protein
MGFSANSSWTYDESNNQIFWFDNCLKTCQKLNTSWLMLTYLYYAFNNESHMAKFQAIICHRCFVEIKMLGLWYVAGAIHGKSLKRKTTESDDKQEKTKKYEENRKAPKFNAMNSPGYISEPQHFDFNKRSVTNYCLKFSHVWFVIKSVVKIRI